MTAAEILDSGREWCAPGQATGRFPHKFIQDFLSGGLADEKDSFQAGCAAAATLPHTFEVMEAQSVKTTIIPDDRKSHTVPIIVSAICTKCRYHFTFRIEAPTGGNMCCSFGNREFPLHHLVRVRERPQDYASCEPDDYRNPGGKYLGCRGHLEYGCTNLKENTLDSERCTFRFVVEVSEPRLPDVFVARLTDAEAYKARFKRESELDPERFRRIPAEMNASRYLATYLLDVTKEPQDRRSSKIPLRNAKFMVNFGNGQDGNELFRWMEFALCRDENAMESWEMPSYERQYPAVIPTRQSFFQDLLAEARLISGQSSVHEGPVLSLEGHLQEALHCSEGQCGVIEVRAESTQTFGEPADYAVLGLTGRTHWRILEFAFDRQTQCDPQNWARYFSALKNLGAAVNQEQLNMRIAMLESSRDFGADPGGQFSLESTITTDPLANEYRLKFSQARTGKEQMALRLELRNVARSRSGGEAAFLQFMEAQPMDILEAQSFLDIEGSLDEMRSMAASELEERARDSDRVNKIGSNLLGTALGKVADLKNSAELKNLAQGLVGGTIMMEEQIFEPRTGAGAVDLTLPAGLKNITNTCYLNSILQYLFTIPSVRELVIEHARYQLPDSDEDRKNRRVATKQSGISTAEYLVAQNFVAELQLLFSNLVACRLSFTEPTQKLAITAMNTAERLAARDSSSPGSSNQLLRSTAKNAPPLPARPAKSGPANTSINSNETSSNLNQAIPKEPTPATSSYNHQNQNVEAEASNGQAPAYNSSADDMAATINNAGQSRPEDESTISRINNALNDGSISGTDQQDVQEVMSNMLQHLQAVTRATGRDPDTNTQTDPITDLFFLTKVTHRQRLSPTATLEWQQSVTPEAYLIAYPEPPVEEKRAISLHEALHKSLELEHVNPKAASDDSWLSYGSIRRLPPVLHICIQRSGDLGHKNGTVITIPTVLYMDRYMESSPGEKLHELRKYFWGLRLRVAEEEARRSVQKKLADARRTQGDDPVAVDGAESGSIDKFARMVNNRHSFPHEQPPADPLPSDTAPPLHVSSQLASVVDTNLPDAPANPDAAATPAFSAVSDIDMVVDEDERTPAPAADPVPSPPAFPTPPTSVSGEGATMAKEAEHLFDHLTLEEYHLHAVICHGGAGTGAGHYWVWIRDFERGVWHKYNDRTVSVHADDDPSVISMLTRSEDPYYLAYIRKDHGGVVSVPRRDL